MQTLERHVARSITKAKGAVSTIDAQFALAMRPPTPIGKSAGALLAHYAANPPSEPAVAVRAIRRELAVKLREAEADLREAERVLRGYEKVAKFLRNEGRVEDCPESLRPAALALKADALAGGGSAAEVAERLSEAVAHGRSKLWAARQNHRSITGAAIVAAKSQSLRLMASYSGFEALQNEAVLERLKASQRRRKDAFVKAQRAANRSAR
jgi:hypothetical protein